jgi:hypothetical protein
VARTFTVWRLSDHAGVPSHCLVSERDGRWRLLVQRGRTVLIAERCASDDAALARSTEIWQVLKERGGRSPRTDMQTADGVSIASHLTMTEERRNRQRRAETLKAVVDRLAHNDDGMTIMELVAVDVTVPPVAAERIVKRLAVRGLVVQGSGGTWEAAPPLRHPAELLRETDLR